MTPAASARRPDTVRVLALQRNGDRVDLLRIDRSASDDADDARGLRPGTELNQAVARAESDAPIWVWDDTARWYPHLLRAGVRVRRAGDLRLRRQILRRSPAVPVGLLDGVDAARWDALAPASDDAAALFDLHEQDAPLDIRAEWIRQNAALAAVADPEAQRRLRLLLTAESSGALVAAELSHVGLPVRADEHARLLRDTIGERPLSAASRPSALDRLIPPLRAALGSPDVNPDVPAQVLAALRRAGLDVTDTRSWTLSQLDHPAIPLLLEYKRLARLASANGWRWLDTWVHDGRYRPTYLPGGVVTGRWAAQGGGALSYPAGLRSAVRADPGWTFLVADVAQLEPRVLAGMSRDLAMAEAAGDSDLYQGLVDRGAVQTRDDAKLAMLGAMYGATSGESGRLVARLTELFPLAFGFVEQAAKAGERGEVVQTFLGRASPAPDGFWTAPLSDLPTDGEARLRERRKWGRFTRNFVVQGTGAEWASCWMATLRNLLWELSEREDLPPRLEQRPHLAFFLHDEIVVHAPQGVAGAVAEAVDEAAATATRLVFGRFPVRLPLKTVQVDSWADA